MFPCERVDLALVDAAGKAPFLVDDSVDPPVTPAQPFEVRADADSRPRWASAITNLRNHPATRARSV